MFSHTMFGILFGTLLIITIIPDATSYSKYGRTCKDIGCRSDETCVMAEDPCNGYSDQCGRYPTCKRTSDAGCSTMVCGQNEYCKTESGVPRCIRKSTAGAPLPGRNRIQYGPIPTIPTPPPRSSSYGGRYSGYSGSRNTVNGGSTYNTRLFGDDRRPRPPRPTSPSRSTTQTSRNNYYETHTHVDSHGNRVWTFSEDDEMEMRAVPKRQSGYPTEAEPRGSSDTPRNSDSQSYPTRSSGYPSGSGYLSSSGNPSSGSSGAIDSTSSNQGRSSYPSSGSSGYPSSGSSGYPSSGSSGYPSSGSSGYPSGGSSGYPSSGSSNYPSSRPSSYPSSGSSGYPSSGSSGYPTSQSSSYPSGGSSGYPSRGSSYPAGSGYPNSHSGSSGYPDYSRNPHGEESVRRTGASNVNAGYPSSGPSTYPDGNPSYRGSYPTQNAGYPSSGYPQYNNQYPLYSNQRYPQGYPQGYPQNNPQGRYPEGYNQGQNYMTTTKKPGFREQITNIARDVAQRVLSQTIVDRITGRHS